MTSPYASGRPQIGVILPTFNRPDLARMAVLQMLAQSRVPDLICAHQNGHPDSYAWAVADLDQSCIIWLHSAESLPQHQWYLRPLRLLIERGCTHFFWVDHDDIYLRHHVEQSLIDLGNADFTVSDACGLLHQNGKDFAYQPEVTFTSHAPGGMSSSMCFNRDFALALADDLAQDQVHAYSDQVLAWVTAPKFQCITTQRRSTVYVSHTGTVSSAHWVEAALPDKTFTPTA